MVDTQVTYAQVKNTGQLVPSVKTTGEIGKYGIQSTSCNDSSSAYSSSGQPHYNTMTLEQQFHLAVQVIKNLPKDSIYQPPDELKLRFYSLFKQATDGPNHTTQPSFYQVVARYKWDAWKQLANMSKEEAMQLYINELKKVKKFKIAQIPSSQVSDPDLKQLMASFLNIIKESNVEKVCSTLVKQCSSEEDASGSGNGYENDGESDTDEFSDAFDPLSEANHTIKTVGGVLNGGNYDVISARGETGLIPTRGGLTSSSGHNIRYPARNNNVNLVPNQTCNANLSIITGGDAGGHNFRTVNREENGSNVLFAILELQKSINTINSRLEKVENELDKKIQRRNGIPKWWPLNLSPQTTIFLLSWPFLAHYLIMIIRNRKRMN